MTTLNITSSTDSHMDNNIMAAVQAVEATDDSPAIPEHTTVEIPMNMSPENKAHFLAEKEAIHLILTEIGDDIYPTVDACQTAQEMWEVIERLQQGQRLDSSTTSAGMVKQYQNEVNELRAERSSAPSPKPSIPPRSHTSTRHKGKEIVKPITPLSKTASEEDNDPEQAQRDKDMQKNLALIAKYFKKIYKPTNNNLRTSTNSKNKNVDTTSRYKNDDHSGQFGNQRTGNVAAARENIGSKVVQQSGIQCFNCKEYVHFAKECRKPKKVKDSAYHKEKLMLYKQSWQELEAHYSYMAKIQEVPTADSGTDSKPVEQVHNDAGYNVFANHLQHSEQSESVSNTCLVETDDSNVILDSPDMCEDDIQNDQNDVESDDEQIVDNAWIKQSKDQFCAPTAQDMEILIQTCLMPLAIKTHNDSFKFVHELKQEMHADLKYVESLEKEIDELESDKAEFSDMYDVILQECVSKDVMKVHTELLQRFAKVVKHSFSDMYDVILQECVSKDVMCSYLQSLSDLDALAELQCMYLHNVKECDCLAQKLLKQTEYVSRKVHTELLQRFAKVVKHSISLEIALQKCKEQIVQLILFIVDSGCMKHMTGNLKLLCNFVEKFLGIVRFGNDQFAPILGYGDLVQGNVMINRVYYVEGLNHNLFSVGQFCDADLEVASGSQHVLLEIFRSKGYRVYNKRIRMIVRSIHIRFDEIKEVSETSVANNTLGLVPQRQKASDYDNSDPVSQRQDVSSSIDEHVPSQKELDLLFGPLYDEFFNAGSNPSTNIQSTSTPSTHTNVHAEENNNDQAEEGEPLQENEFTNPFCVPTQEVSESSSHNIGNSNAPTFNQPQVSEYRWTKYHPLKQVRGNPSRLVQTR
nr:integrase, catalytic region, zinc finger, CCHC-type, peptidase aspartic, catalytic [Tanacetum cinerariifolium]